MIWARQHGTLKASSCCLVGIECLLYMVNFLASIARILAMETSRLARIVYQNRIGHAGECPLPPSQVI
jgi:hypothetical protein